MKKLYVIAILLFVCALFFGAGTAIFDVEETTETYVPALWEEISGERVAMFTTECPANNPDC